MFMLMCVFILIKLRIILSLTVWYHKRLFGFHLSQKYRSISLSARLRFQLKNYFHTIYLTKFIWGHSNVRSETELFIFWYLSATQRNCGLHITVVKPDLQTMCANFSHDDQKSASDRGKECEREAQQQSSRKNSQLYVHVHLTRRLLGYPDVSKSKIII